MHPYFQTCVLMFNMKNVKLVCKIFRKEAGGQVRLNYQSAESLVVMGKEKVSCWGKM